MELTERRTDNAVIVTPQGRIDMQTASQFETSLIPLVKEAGQAKNTVIIDFSGVDYISSAGLRVIMMAAKEARQSGARVAVASLQPLVSEIFQISRFDKVVACHGTVDEALAAITKA